MRSIAGHSTGRERCRSEGRGLVHQGPRVRGTKVGTPDGQGYLQILSLSPSFALVLVPPSTPRSSACDRMTDDELAAIIARAKLTEQQWVPETCISASQIMSPMAVSNSLGQGSFALGNRAIATTGVRCAMTRRSHICNGHPYRPS